MLVVRADNRKLTGKAVMNIYNECRELGLDVGLDPDAFVRSQSDFARAFSVALLPPEAELPR